MHLALHSVNLLFKKAIFNEKKQGKAKLHKNVAENQQVLWSIESKLGNFWFNSSPICAEEVRREIHQQGSLAID